MTWLDKIATAEVKNVPAGAILLASAAQALGVVGAGLLVNKWPAMDKYAHPLVGGGGAVVVSQLKGQIGESGSNALAMGLGTQAVAPYIGKGIGLLISAVTPKPATPAAPARRSTTTYKAPVGEPSEADLAAAASAGIEAR